MRRQNPDSMEADVAKKDSSHEDNDVQTTHEGEKKVAKKSQMTPDAPRPKKRVEDTNVMNKGTAIVGFVLSFVTGAGFMYALDRGNAKEEATATAEKGGAAGGAEGAWKQDAPIPISSEDPSEGPRGALVTIVEFSDYQ